MSLHDLLYFAHDSSAEVFSHIPSRKVSIPRLVLNLPPFLVTRGASTQNKPKVLVLPKIKLNKEKWKLLNYRLGQLKKAGFLIQSYECGEFCDYNELSHTSHDLPSLEELCTQLDKPADEILVLDDQIIGEILEDDTFDLAGLAPFKEVSIESFFSERQFNTLLADHADTIESLKLCGCHNLTTARTVSLPNLKDLSINFGEDSNSSLIIPKTAKQLQGLELINYKRQTALDFHYLTPEKLEVLKLSLSDIDNAWLKRLLQNSTPLRILHLDRCSNIASNSLYEDIDCSALEELSLYDISLDISSLQKILRKAPNLKKLEMMSFKIEDSAVDLDLKNLECLDIYGFNITCKSLKSLLNDGQNIKKLRLRRCTYLNKGELQNLNLTNLEELKLDYSNINWISLNTLLEKATKLKVLSLWECEIFNQPVDIPALDLASLTQLNLQSSNINLSLLQALLNKATQLETLCLTGCKYLNQGELFGLNLGNLETLDASFSYINLRSLQAILKNAHKLKRLDLSNCQNLAPGTLLDLDLSNLEELDLGSSTISLISLQAILKNAHKLKKLELRDCQNLGPGALLDLDLSNLEELDLSSSTISLISLQAILKNAPKLRKLNLRNCQNLGPGALLDLDLSNLEELDLGSSTISLISLQAILKKTTKLKKLAFDKCQNLNQDNLFELLAHLTNLEHLDVEHSRIDLLSLQCILRKNPKLKRLSLAGCTNLNEGELADLDLCHLEELCCNFSNINPSSLYTLLKKARCQELSLVGLGGLNELDFSTLDLTNVEILDLEASDINISSLKMLLKKTPQLRSLYLGYCRNLSEGDLADINLPNLKNVSVCASNISSRSLKAFVNTEAEINGCDEVDSDDDCDISAHANDPFAAYSSFQSPLASPKSVDADTTNKAQKFNLHQEFLGDPIPNITLIRKNAFNRLELNASNKGEKDPFILRHQLASFEHLKSAPVAKARTSLFDKFKENAKERIFGKLDLKLSPSWQRLPSVNANDILTDYWCSDGSDLEFIKSEQDGFYYVKSKTSKTITLEVLFKKTAPSDNPLPQEVEDLIRDCRGFREEKLELGSGKSALEYLQALMKERCGSCRHRSVIFKHFMEEKFPHIPVQIIENDCHSFVEVNYRGEWKLFDLGGYPQELNINPLPEAQRFVPQNKAQTPVEETYQTTFSDRGEPVSYDYFQRAKHLTILDINNSNNINFITHPLLQLDTLTITSCEFSAAALHRLLELTPNIRTLSLKHCTMSAEEFDKIDLSTLKQLEHVTFVGRFIPNPNALKKVACTAPTAKWIAESINLTADRGEPLVVKPSPAVIITGATAPKITTKSCSRRVPAHRYFKKSIPSMPLDWLRTDWKKGLIDCEHPDALSRELQQHCLNENRPCYFIQNPDELRCAAPFIVPTGANCGVLKKGPGGPFYNFLKQHEHDDSVVVIDFSRFSPSEIVKWNSVLGEEDNKSKNDGVYLPSEEKNKRKVDGVSLPKGLKIIGLTNTKSPRCYNGPDFKRRFDYKTSYQVNTPLKSVENLFTRFNQQEPLEIELANSQDWSSMLLGTWVVKDHQLSFKEGELLHALKSGQTNFIFNHAPLQNASFQRFLRDLELYQTVFDEGLGVRRAIPQKFSVSYTKKIDFSPYQKCLSFAKNPPTHPHPLNSQTLADFLGKYSVLPATKGISLKPGLLESHAHKSLLITVTESLDAITWLKFIKMAEQYEVKCKLTLSPNVSLPEGLLSDTSPLTTTFAETAHTGLIKKEEGLLAHCDETIIIDVSELSAEELLSSIKNDFDEETTTFSFTTRPSYLRDKLKENKTIILKGEFKPELTEALHHILFSRLTTKKPVLGKLYLIPQDESLFSFMKPSKGNYYPHLKGTVPAVQTVEYEERYSKVAQALEEQALLFLTGDSGVGKTYFMKEVWQKKHPNYHEGEAHILDWILDTRAGIKTLFIDEGNLAHSEWSFLKGLRENPPGIFYQGVYYLLSKDHKVIFAGNPLSFGGERQALFNNEITTIEFKALPVDLKENLLGLSSLDKSVSKVILNLIGEHECLTPRELIMIGALTKAALKQYPEFPAETWGRYFATAILKTYTPLECPALSLPPLPAQLGKLIVHSSNEEAIRIVNHHLDLRALRLLEDKDIPKIGGLGGVILEGPSGIGKSLLSIACLTARGLIANQDFYEIEASLGNDIIEERLLKVFREGKIVVIDEINSSEMPERLLNALLEGHDLEGNVATAGFMIIGSQNPISFQGRKKTPLPLKHRLHTVVMKECTEKDRALTLKVMGIPPIIAFDMIEEFKQLKAENKELTDSELFRVAKAWIENHPQDILKPLCEPQPQVGSVCKVTALANIENHYAKTVNFEPIPFRSHKSGKLSLRKLAKKLGSVQGELLEFQQWERLFNKVGYETNTVTFDSINLFLQTILEALDNNHYPLLSFCVDESGHPNTNLKDAETREHAAIITGYHADTDELTITHWGKEFRVDLVSLFNANQILAKTRQQEFYEKNIEYTNMKENTPKYYPSNTPKPLYSLIPSPDSGFQGKLYNDPRNLDQTKGKF